MRLGRAVKSVGGAVNGGWIRVGMALGSRTCLRVELKEERWGGRAPPSLPSSKALRGGGGASPHRTRPLPLCPSPAPRGPLLGHVC